MNKNKPILKILALSLTIVFCLTEVCPVELHAKENHSTGEMNNQTLSSGFIDTEKSAMVRNITLEDEEEDFPYINGKLIEIADDLYGIWLNPEKKYDPVMIQELSSLILDGEHEDLRAWIAADADMTTEEIVDYAERLVTAQDRTLHLILEDFLLGIIHLNEKITKFSLQGKDRGVPLDVVTRKTAIISKAKDYFYFWETSVTIRDYLNENNKKHLLAHSSRIFGRPIEEAEIENIELWLLKGGDYNHVIRVEVSLKTDPRPRYFAVITSLSEKKNQETWNQFDSNKYFYFQDFEAAKKYLPEPYEKAETTVTRDSEIDL